MFGIWLWGLGAVMVCVGLLWLWSLRLQDVSIIDSFWGVGFVISVWIYVALSPGSSCSGAVGASCVSDPLGAALSRPYRDSTP